MCALNPNQTRILLARLAHVDSLFKEILHLAAGERSAWAKEVPDVSADEAGLLRSSIALARTRMLNVLDHLGIARPTADLSARWSIETSLQFVDLTLSELTPHELRGYGEVDAVAAGDLAALAADLRHLVAKARQTLHDDDAEGLRAAIDHIAGPAGEVLRGIEALSRERGLAEVRPLLAAAAERAAGTALDVGVFGRTSAGKSSFINALVGEAVLPVGALPVTAVPLRVSRGAAGAVVRFVKGEPRNIAVSAIAEFATETANPDNQLGVRAIEITVPTVPEGLRLLDTPGVGSLNSGGSALAFAWLPRCDLGLVLVAAGSAIGRDDLALVAGLQHAGIRCIVLLSKADLLAAAEVTDSIAYIRRELSASLGPDMTIDVRPIAITTGPMPELEAFQESFLLPLARDAERSAKSALTERLRRLIRVTAAAMAGRTSAVDSQTIQLERLRSDTLVALRQACDAIGVSAPTLLGALIDQVLDAWNRGEDGNAIVKAVITRHAGNALQSIRHLVEGGGTATDASMSDKRRIPPLFDPDLLDTLPDLSSPGSHLLRSQRSDARRKLAAIEAPLAQALQTYANRLNAWGSQALAEWSTHQGDVPAMTPDDALPVELSRLDQMLNNEPAVRAR